MHIQPNTQRAQSANGPHINPTNIPHGPGPGSGTGPGPGPRTGPGPEGRRSGERYESEMEFEEYEPEHDDDDYNNEWDEAIEYAYDADPGDDYWKTTLGRPTESKHKTRKAKHQNTNQGTSNEQRSPNTFNSREPK